MTRDLPLVLPAAGFGTRMRSVDPDKPKELLPLAGTTVLGRAVREAEAAGVREVIVVIRKGKEALRDHLLGLSTPCRFAFAYQTDPLGEADAIACARELVGARPFAVLYPDNVALDMEGAPDESGGTGAKAGPGMLRQVLRCYRDALTGHGAGDLSAPDAVCLTRVRQEHARVLGNAGRVEVRERDDGRLEILGFLPKGEGHFRLRHDGEWRAQGCYVTGEHFFEAVERVRRAGYQGELTDGKVRRALLAQGRPILGCPVAMPVLDAGNRAGYAMLKRMMKRTPGKES